MVLTEENRMQVYKDRSSGLSLQEVAERNNCSPETVRKIIKKVEEYNTVKTLPGRGRKRSTNAHQDCAIVREGIFGKIITAKEIKENLGFGGSLSTIRRRLRDDDLIGAIARRRPLITPKNQKKRLEFARENIDKPEEFWQKIIWSDESKFEKNGSKRRVTCWRRRGEGLKREFIIPTVKHSGSVMAWGCMHASGVGQIAFIDSRINAEMYIDILLNNLELSAHSLGLGNDFIFQQDNDPKHTSRKAQQFFIENGINILKWPPQSPDLNPIEHLWDELDRRIPQQRRKSLQDFRNAIVEIWSKIRSEVTSKLVKSLPNRLLEVLKAKGGPTKY